MNSKVCVGKSGELVKNLICPVIVDLQPEGTLPDLESLNEAIRFLDTKENITNNQPYFLAIGFHKPHVPFKFPIKYLDYHPLENITLPKNRWRPSSLPDVAWNPWTDIRWRDDIKQLNVPFPYGPLPDETIRKIIQAYNAATTYIDHLVGQLLERVDENTIIVFTADHGWSRGEHGEFSKFSNYDEATRVPLLLHVPGLTTREIISEGLVELVDIFPTLVDLTQLSEPLPTCDKSSKVLCTEGRSLVPHMIDKITRRMKHTSETKSAIFTQYPRPGPHPTLIPNSDKPHLKDIKIMGYSIRTDNFRYTEWVKFNSRNFSIYWKKVYGMELYDHAFDPLEDLNLADRSDMQSVIKDLRRKLILGWRHAL